MIKLTDILKQIIQEKEDRCKRIADRKYDKPSAYKSGAIVRCRKGDIWKDLKEGEYEDDSWEIAYDKHVEMLKIFSENILEIPYNKSNVNVGQSDGEEDGGIIYINSKIYGDNPTLFTTYHRDDNGNLLDYEYDPYKPINLTPDEIEDIINDFKLKKLGLKEDESLHKWFKRQGPKGKEGGWVDCNAPDGKGGYKACGRKEGEKRSKYPSCRPTPAACKDKGKGKTWGKTK
jgi:hypothetical protein